MIGVRRSVLLRERCSVAQVFGSLLGACSEHFGVFGGSKCRQWRLFDGCLKCSGAPQACLGGSGSSRSHDPSALSEFGGYGASQTRVLEGSGAPSWRPRELQKSRSIGPVNVWRPRPLQNSSSGEVGAAILETFVIFEASQMATRPIGPRATALRRT